MRRSALHAARSQIAWILALVISTAIVVRLEQVSFEDRLSLLTANPFKVEATLSEAMLTRVTAADWGTSDLHLAQKATSMALVLMSQPVTSEVMTDAIATLAATRAQSEIADPADRPMLEVAATILQVALESPNRASLDN
jgi:hypothetical protein